MGDVWATHLGYHIKQTRGLLWIGILKFAEENVHNTTYCSVRTAVKEEALQHGKT
jgi:hypothetical protein